MRKKKNNYQQPKRHHLMSFGPFLLLLHHCLLVSILPPPHFSLSPLHCCSVWPCGSIAVLTVIPSSWCGSDSVCWLLLAHPYCQLLAPAFHLVSSWSQGWGQVLGCSLFSIVFVLLLSLSLLFCPLSFPHCCGPPCCCHHPPVPTAPMFHPVSSCSQGWVCVLSCSPYPIVFMPSVMVVPVVIIPAPVALMPLLFSICDPPCKQLLTRLGVGAELLTLLPCYNNLTRKREKIS